MNAERERAAWGVLCHDLRTPLNLILGYGAMLLDDTAALSTWVDRAPELERARAAGVQLLAMLVDGAALAEPGHDHQAFTAGTARIQHGLRPPIRAVVSATDRLLGTFRATDQDQEHAFAVDLRRIRGAAGRFLATLDDFSAGLEAPRGPPDPSAGEALPGEAESLPPPESFAPPGPATRSPSRQEPGEAVAGKLLVADDNKDNRDVLSRRLSRQGHTVSVVSRGRDVLDLLRRERFDMVLLDVIMPEMDGYQVLEQMKADEDLARIPVIMISARDDLESVVRCIELGAEDYLSKPFNPVLLRARVGASLTQKRLRDRERSYLEQLRTAQEQSEAVLLNVFPRSIVERLKLGESSIADHFESVTVLFADLVGFTAYSAGRSPATVVRRLNEIFSTFDALAERHGVEKIKTIGDGYLAVSGLPVARPDHAEAMAEMALDMQRAVAELGEGTGERLAIRTGLNSGPVEAGIIGTRRFSYDIWGDTVNTASRMESTGPPGAIQVSDATRSLLEGRYVLEPRGTIDVKGKGRMETSLLLRRK